jgi:hypothetical protein
MRQRLKTIETYKAIKSVFDTNFLNGITEKIVRKRQQEFFDDSQSNQNQKRQKNQEDNDEEFRFDNMTANSGYDPLHKAVVYDSECSDHLTYDKDRFIDEIRPACE